MNRDHCETCGRKPEGEETLRYVSMDDTVVCDDCYVNPWADED